MKDEKIKEEDTEADKSVSKQDEEIIEKSITKNFIVIEDSKVDGGGITL